MTDVAIATESDRLLHRCVERAGRLYTLPAVATEVLELTGHPRVDVPRLKAAIEKDPALTVRLLKVVNSSVFGLSGQVSDLGQALALLGIGPLKLLVLGFSLPERLLAVAAGDALARFWRCALTRAVAAREIARRHFQLGGDEAFLCGLLADLGVLVLFKELGEPYGRFLDEAHQQQQDAASLERASLGFTHAEVTARLLQSWGLPVAFARAVSAPRNIESLRRKASGEDHLPQVLHLADLLARLVALEQMDVLPELLEAARTYRGVGPQQITLLVEDIGGGVHDLADVLSLDIRTGRDYRDILLEAHRQLSQAADEAAPVLARKQEDEAELPDKLLREVRSLAAAARRLAAAPDDVAYEPNADSPVPATAPLRSGGVVFAPTLLGPASSIDPGLLGRAEAMAAHCRQSRQEMSLLLVEFDRYAELTVLVGLDAPQRAIDELLWACQSLEHRGRVALVAAEGRVAVLLPDCDRRQAVQLASDLTRRSSTQQRAASSLNHSLSAGVASIAVPPKNFAAEEMIRAAERCLAAAQTSGGAGVKSIELL